MAITVKKEADSVFGSILSEDFATVDATATHVILEANEWNETTQMHYVVTLYLHPSEARMLGNSLLGLAERVMVSKKRLN